MRSIATLVLFFPLATCLFAQPEQSLQSEITAVTVYQNGAQLTRSAEVNLNAGRSKLVFGKLTREINPQSIALSGNGDFTILSISHRNNFLNEEQLTEELQNIQDSIEHLDGAIKRLKARASGLENEKQLILANQNIGGNNGIVSLEQLQEIARFTSKRITEINLALLEIADKVGELEERHRRLHQQLNQDRARLRDRPGEVVVEVEATSTQRASLQLSYLIRSAGWQSSYDARVNSLDEPVELTHKARIYQQSGEDWQGVDLTLSTANPTVGGQVPFLNTWFVGFQHQYQKSISATSAAALKNADARMESQERIMVQGDAGGQTFVVEDNITQQEYGIERKQNIPSGTQPTTVQLRQLSLPAEYQYHIKPRLDNDAFLIAMVHGWEQYDLLKGELSLYNRETYVGKSYLNPTVAQDSLPLSMGRDQGIVVNRERVLLKEQRSFLGGKRIDDFNWRIEVRNNKGSAVDILLKEPIPVATNEEIEVELIEQANANYDEDSGILRWRFTLQPAGNKLINLRYEVKYPKERQLQY